MAITLHKNAPFNELHNAKLRTGTRPATPEGVGDAHWNPSTNTLSLADAVGTVWEEFVLSSGSSSLTGASVYNTSTTFFLNVHPTAPADIDWNAEHFDGATYHDNVTNPARLTAPATGIYLVGWSLIKQAGGTTVAYRVQVKKNGTNIYTNNLIYEFSPSLGGLTIQGQNLVSLNAGDYLTLAASASTSSGGMAGIDGLIGGSSFWIQRMS